MGKHNVVITVLPAGEFGANTASHVATNMSRSFQEIKFALLVGTGGGIPSPKHDIRLGDIVVSKPNQQDGGVFQYDLGRNEPDKFVKISSLNSPPLILRTAITTLKAEHSFLGGNKIPDYLSIATNQSLPPIFTYPHNEPDNLFRPDCLHVSGNKTCDYCDQSKLEKRSPRKSTDPVIHYSTIASGNQIIKNALNRDQLAVM